MLFDETLSRLELYKLSAKTRCSLPHRGPADAFLMSIDSQAALEKVGVHGSYCGLKGHTVVLYEVVLSLCMWPLERKAKRRLGEGGGGRGCWLNIQGDGC